MSKPRRTVDGVLRDRLSPEDWERYKRLTRTYNSPPLPWMRRTLFAAAGVTVACLVGMSIAMGTSTNGGANATPWIQGVICTMFLGLLGAGVVGSVERRTVRAKTLPALRRLEATAENHPTRAEFDDDYPAPFYPVTDGQYNPRLYISRGGRATARLLADQGYQDWETYEANKPD